MKSLLGAVLLVACAAGCARRAPEAQQAPSSSTTTVTVYVARRVRTLDAQRPIAEALSVRAGKVLAVGTRDEVLASAGAGARVVDLGDATVVPGLTDAHAHLAGLGRSLAGVRLDGTASRDEVLSRRSRPCWMKPCARVWPNW